MGTTERYYSGIIQNGKLRMLFRIEDSENKNGIHRRYKIPEEELNEFFISDLNHIIAEEIRKEVNGSKQRNLLSYSKSLGMCLLKYNCLGSNALHINLSSVPGMVQVKNECGLNLESGFEKNLKFQFPVGIKNSLKNKKVILINFCLDISNDKQLDSYLRKNTTKKIGLKSRSSPEKDQEVVMMQSPYDGVIKEYSFEIYLLYSLYLKYGMPHNVYKNLKKEVKYFFKNISEQSCRTEKTPILDIIEYLYKDKGYEKMVFETAWKYYREHDETIFLSPFDNLVNVITAESFNDIYGNETIRILDFEERIKRCYKNAYDNNELPEKFLKKPY